MSLHRLREIPKHNCLKRWHNEVVNLAPDQPCKVRKTTEDKYCDHEQEGDGILVEEAGILDRHDFGDGRARYEAAPEAHHDHLIDVETGKVVEFVDPEIEALQKQIAAKLGYRLVDHRLELYGVRLDREG